MDILFGNGGLITYLYLNIFPQEISYEIDSHHDAYMDFMNQCLETPDLLVRVTEDLCLEEKHLIYLELMIMEQVEDWEMGIGKTNAESSKNMIIMSDSH